MGIFSKIFGTKAKPKRDGVPVAKGVAKPPREVGLGPLREFSQRDVPIDMNAFYPSEGTLLGESGWLGRRDDLHEPLRVGDLPLAFPDDEDRALYGDDLADFLSGKLALMVDSTMFYSLSYNPDNMELRAKLNKGGTFIHSVDHDFARRFAFAHSKGDFWWTYVGTRGEGGKGVYKVPTSYVRG